MQSDKLFEPEHAPLLVRHCTFTVLPDVNVTKMDACSCVGNTFDAELCVGPGRKISAAINSIPLALTLLHKLFYKETK